MSLRRRNRTDLTGRTAVITGAASGMGRALAQLLAGRGSPVAITDVDERGLAETERSIGGPVLARRLDVRDRDAHHAFARHVRNWSPAPLGAVFNNAGVTLSQTVADVSPEDFEWIVDINFWGVVHGTKAYLPWLLEQDSGAVVNTSSVFGLIGWPTQATYNATKFGVRGFTEALRHELRDTGVNAVSVHPGGVATNIVRNARFHVDDRGGTSQETLQQDFERVAHLSPAKAAQIIVRGVERGNPRIRVGYDAVVIDLLQRVAPRRYFDVINRLEPFMRNAAGAGTEAHTELTADLPAAAPAPSPAEHARERSGAA
jgi:NAD(P)-dependent dehydrogenase (short-subunit alcohol dehydrogenase family)